MTNVRARLLGLSSCLLLALPLLWTGCGEESSSGEDASASFHDSSQPPPPGRDADEVEPPDAQPAGLDAGGPGLDAEAAGPDAAAPGPDAGTAGPDAASAGPDASESCPRVAKAADRARKLVVAHPFKDDPNGNFSSNAWEVFDLSATGTITQPSPRVTFTMGRAIQGQMVFTPDGEIGVVAQGDGTVGEVKFDASGTLQVLQVGFTGAFYASKVVMDPSGERFYVIEQGLDTNGGGVYSVRIGCDGTLFNEGKVFSASMPGGLSFPAALPEKAFVAGKRVLASPGTTNAHLLNWAPGAKPTRVASAAVFPDDDAIVSDAITMPDGKWGLVSDSATSRVGVVELQATAVVAKQVLSPLPDPQQLVVSPYGNSAMVVCSMSDSLWPLLFDSGNAATPFSIGTKVTSVQPGGAVQLTAGALSDRVFVAELEGIRQVQFAANGSLTNLGLTRFLSSYEAICGAMGIQP